MILHTGRGYFKALPTLLLLVCLYPALSPTCLATDKKLNPKLLKLSPNKWVKLYQPLTLDWRRQRHAGIAYDSKRGTLLTFGSDTHNMDWDNSVHEFDPVSEQWTTHYPAAAKESYRTDGKGHAIAGAERLLPWAMHTYDQIVYDPRLDALVVAAVPEHNPIHKKVPGDKVYPTWIYDLQTHQWRIMANQGKPYPKFFGAASAYDSVRDVVVFYKYGIWELGPRRDHWQRAIKEGHHMMHYTMEFDSKRGQLAVFGDYKNSNVVWLYTPGNTAGAEGSWQQRIPEGDPCPRDGSIPVAFDSDQGVFLLLPDNIHYGPDNKPRKARSSSTFVYEPGANRYLKLPQGDMDAMHMNYMMAYDRFHKVFLLVSGDWREPPTVWALRLDLDALQADAP